VVVARLARPVAAGSRGGRRRIFWRTASAGRWLRGGDWRSGGAAGSRPVS